MYASLWNYYYTKLFSHFLTHGAFKVYLHLVKSTCIHKMLTESNLQRTRKAVREAICEKSIWLQDLKLANIPYHNFITQPWKHCSFMNAIQEYINRLVLYFCLDLFLRNRTVCQRQSQRKTYLTTVIATVLKLVKRGLTLQNAVTF